MTGNGCVPCDDLVSPFRCRSASANGVISRRFDQREALKGESLSIVVSGYRVNAKDSVTIAVTESFKAGEGDRTLDINLGKVALYH